MFPSYNFPGTSYPSPQKHFGMPNNQDKACAAAVKRNPNETDKTPKSPLPQDTPLLVMESSEKFENC